MAIRPERSSRSCRNSPATHSRALAAAERRTACQKLQAEFAPRLAHALTLDLPSLLAVPAGYSLDVAMSSNLGTPTTAT